MKTRPVQIVRLALAGLLAFSLAAALAPPAEAGPSVKGDNFFNPKAGSQRARSTPNAHRGNKADYGHRRSAGQKASHRGSRGHARQGHRSASHKRSHARGHRGHSKHASGGHKRGHSKHHGFKRHGSKHHGAKRHGSRHHGLSHHAKKRHHGSGLSFSVRLGSGHRSGAYVGYGTGVYYGSRSPHHRSGHRGDHGHSVIDRSHSTSNTYKRWRHYNDIEHGRIPHRKGYDYHSSSPYDGHVRSYRRSVQFRRDYKLVYPDNVVVVDRGQRSGGALAQHGIERGFELLEHGRAGAALTQFAAIAEDERHATLPKVGYGLAAAMRGDHRKAAWALRRAIVIDPESLLYIPVTASLRERLEAVAFHYQAQVEERGGRVDDWFLYSAMRFILGDVEAAAYAAENAISRGDSTVAASALLRTAREQLPRGSEPSSK